MPVIGFLGSESPALSADRLRAFHQGLGEAGFVEGRNVAIEYRWAEGRYDRLPALADDLVSRHVAVIFASPGVAAVAAKSATKTVPIVFASGIDPVEYGLVASLNRPGGNLTGASALSVTLQPKRLELAHELVPMATIVAYLDNPTNPVGSNNIGSDNAAIEESNRAAARSLGLRARRPAREQRARLRCGLRAPASAASRCARAQPRSVSHRPGRVQRSNSVIR
jgi:putative ABC transport system substrate-binding protein